MGQIVDWKLRLVARLGRLTLTLPSPLKGEGLGRVVGRFLVPGADEVGEQAEGVPQTGLRSGRKGVLPKPHIAGEPVCSPAFRRSLGGMAANGRHKTA